MSVLWTLIHRQSLAVNVARGNMSSKFESSEDSSPSRSGLLSEQIRHTTKYATDFLGCPHSAGFNNIFVLPPSFRIPEVPDWAEPPRKGRI
jgi:hypothetical protein